MNILEALKKYIRANGGSSRANNISEAVKDLDSIPQGSGGGGIVVTIDLDYDAETGIADKTHDEIVDAISVGNYVVFKFMYAGELFMYIPFSGYEYNGAAICAQFGDVSFFCESGTTWAK